MRHLRDLSSELRLVQCIVFDFDGVFTDNTVTVSQDGVESVTCWRSDGLGLSRVAAIGVRLAIVSTEKNPVVGARAAKLRLPVRQGVDDKAQAVRALCEEFGVDPARTVFVGNDINDIEAFRIVGLPVAVQDAYPEVLPFVKAVTQRPGGRGAVREICDLVHAALTFHDSGSPHHAA